MVLCNKIKKWLKNHLYRSYNLKILGLALDEAGKFEVRFAKTICTRLAKSPNDPKSYLISQDKVLESLSE